MNRTFFFILISVFVFIGINTVLYFTIYNQQLEFQTELLARQAQLCGNTIEQEGLRFENELNSIPYQDDFSRLFSDEEVKLRGSTNLQKLYTGYKHLINKITVYDNHSNVYSLILDSKNNFVSDYYESQQQVALNERERLIAEDDNYILSIPEFDKDGVVQSNILVDLNFSRFVNDIFERYALEEILWQSLISEEGRLISSAEENILIPEGDLKRIASDIQKEDEGSLVHTIMVDSNATCVVSVYYPVRLVNRNLGVLFSIKTGLFLNSIIIKIIIVTLCSLVLLAFLLYIHFRVIHGKTEQLQNRKFSEESLLKTFDLLPVGLIFVNPDDSVRLMNRAARVITAQEDPGKKLFYPELGLDESTELYGDALYQRSWGPGVLILHHNETSVKHIYKMEWTSEIGDLETRIVMLLDVSEFDSARNLDKVSQLAKSELLEKMAVEISAPLAELQKTVNELDHENLQKSCSLLSNLIRATMDFAVQDAYKVVVEEIPYDLRDEIDLALAAFRGNNPDLSIITKIRNDVPDKLVGDPFRLRQAVYHLVENALELTTEGRILISAEIINQHPGLLTLQVNVEDTGSGLTEEKIQAIMAELDRFTLKSPEKPDDFIARLAIARQHINLMKGRLWLKSPSTISTSPDQPGLKSSFTFVAFPGESIKENLVFNGIRHLEEIKCLVLSQEKDAENERLGSLINLGMKFNHLIYRKENTDSLFELVSEKASSLQMVMVSHSSTEDGINVAKELIRRNITENQIVVLLCADHKPEYCSICREAGIDYYIEAPYEPHRFLSIFSRHFPELSREELEKFPEPAKINETLSILLAEDNLFNRKVIQGLFKRLGLEIDLAENGSQAVDMIRENTYDIVFLDLLMPKLDGFQAASEMRKQGFDKPIIALTALEGSDTRKAAMESGFDDYLIKPASVDMLRNVLVKNSSSPR